MGDFTDTSVYGPIETLRRRGRLSLMRPAEQAVQHLLTPAVSPDLSVVDDGDLLLCCRCGGCKPPDAFDIEARNTRRAGRRSECKTCRSREGKQQRLLKHHQRRADVFPQGNLAYKTVRA